MNNILFSIIIPVYNTERYIGNCLNSILSQDLEQDYYEIILIDDGSSDGSFDVLSNFLPKFKNIHLVKKRNEGVSVARNIGIDIAAGDYILFIDSDDRIAHNSLFELAQFLTSSSVDMLIGRSFNETNNGIGGENYSFSYEFVEGCYSGTDLLVKNSYFRGSVCGIIFNTNFIKGNNIRFFESAKNGEDTLFVLISCLYAKNIEFVDLLLYLVKRRVGSASRIWNFEKVLYMTAILKELKQISNSNNWTSDQYSLLNFGLYSVTSTMFNLLFYNFSFKNYKILRREILKSSFKKLDTGNIELCKNKIRIYNISINLFASIILFRKLYYKIISF